MDQKVKFTHHITKAV
jgi:hypothetical protein